MNNQQLKYIIAVLIFLFVCIYTVFAQTNDSIRVETSILGIKYYKNNHY